MTDAENIHIEINAGLVARIFRTSRGYGVDYTDAETGLALNDATTFYPSEAAARAALSRSLSR